MSVIAIVATVHAVSAVALLLALRADSRAHARALGGSEAGHGEPAAVAVWRWRDRDADLPDAA